MPRPFLFALLVLSVVHARAEDSALSSLLSWDSVQDWKYPILEDTSHHKIFWWNIGCGVTNSKLKEKYGEDYLYTNISHLAQSDVAPDMIILGEHCPTPMPASTKDALDDHYPYSSWLEKSNPYLKTRNGILVYSKYPLKRLKKVNLEAGLDKEETHKTTRTYLLFKVEFPEGDIFVSPVHLYNPWGEMDAGELLSKGLGTDNVNYRQADLLMKNLKKDVDFSKDKVIVIGDFNSLKNFVFLNMAAYNLFASELYDGGLDEATYPSNASLEVNAAYPPIHIDHAFTSSLIDSPVSSMIPMKGSDHTPILLSF